MQFTGKKHPQNSLAIMLSDNDLKHAPEATRSKSLDDIVKLAMHLGNKLAIQVRQRASDTTINGKNASIYEIRFHACEK